MEQIDFVSAAGAVESDGGGTVLTTPAWLGNINENTSPRQVLITYLHPFILPPNVVGLFNKSIFKMKRENSKRVTLKKLFLTILISLRFTIIA